MFSRLLIALVLFWVVLELDHIAVDLHVIAGKTH